LGRPPARTQGGRARRTGRRWPHPVRRARRAHPADLVRRRGPPATRRAVAVGGRAPRGAGPDDGGEGRRRADPRRWVDATARSAGRGRLRLHAARSEAAWLAVPEGDTVWRAARRLDRALSGKVLTRTDFRVPELATWD